MQREEEEQFARSLLINHYREMQVNRDVQQRRRQIEDPGAQANNTQIRARDEDDQTRIVSLAQARRHHLRQQLTPEEQEEFDEAYDVQHFGSDNDQDDMLSEQDQSELEDEGRDFHEGDVENLDEDCPDDGEDEEGIEIEQDQMEYFMQRHPDLFMVVDDDTYRQHQAQMRLV